MPSGPPWSGRPRRSEVRTLVTGGAGLLGHALAVSAPDDVLVEVTQRRSLASGARAHTIDLAEPGAFELLVLDRQPDLVIHTAYGTADPERDIVAATSEVASACAVAGVGLVHLSSDMVFDGDHAPYGEDATLSPVTEYGLSKARAEAKVFSAVNDAAVVRTSLITSLEPLDRVTAWVIGALKIRRPITLFHDEVRSAVRLDDLARQVWEVAGLARGERAGVWHLGGAEALSRYDLGMLIAAHAGLDASTISSGTVRDHPERRPADLTLASSRAGGLSSEARAVSTLFTD